MPECDVILSHCVTFLARSAKSVACYKAMKNVKQLIETKPAYAVPLHLRNAPTELMKNMGYGFGYRYNPDHPEEDLKQSYMPPGIANHVFFEDKYQ
jgi:putative ATPase